MSARTSARHTLGQLGINRSLAVRVLTRLGHPRLRELRDEAMSAPGLRARLLRAAVQRIEAGTVTVPVGHAQGLRFALRHLPLDHAHIGSIASGQLETAVQEAMVRHLGSGDVLYDIGANVGFFSLLGARLVGEAGHVYAFEPVAENAGAIREHADMNGLGNVSVVEGAVAGASSRARLQVVADRSWSKLTDYGEHPLTEEVVEVETVAIDDLAELRPATLVKIDVEGAELAVLEGMARTLGDHRPAVICELHGTHREFAAFMASHDYRVINLEGPAPIEDAGASAHALALPALHLGD